MDNYLFLEMVYEYGNMLIGCCFKFVQTGILVFQEGSRVYKRDTVVYRINLFSLKRKKGGGVTEFR